MCRSQESDASQVPYFPFGILERTLDQLRDDVWAGEAVIGRRLSNAKVIFDGSVFLIELFSALELPLAASESLLAG